MLTVALARSSYGGDALRTSAFVDNVILMTSCFQARGWLCVMFIHKRRQRDSRNYAALIHSDQILLNEIVSCAPGA